MNCTLKLDRSDYFPAAPLAQFSSLFHLLSAISRSTKLCEGRIAEAAHLTVHVGRVGLRTSRLHAPGYDTFGEIFRTISEIVRPIQIITAKIALPSVTHKMGLVGMCG